MDFKIDDDLHERLARRAEQTGFDSAEEYATVVLKTVVDELEGERNGDGVEERLEDLGYL